MELPTWVWEALTAAAWLVNVLTPWVWVTVVIVVIVRFAAGTAIRGADWLIVQLGTEAWTALVGIPLLLSLAGATAAKLIEEDPSSPRFVMWALLTAAFCLGCGLVVIFAGALRASPGQLTLAARIGELRKGPSTSDDLASVLVAAHSKEAELQAKMNRPRRKRKVSLLALSIAMLLSQIPFKWPLAWQDYMWLALLAVIAVVVQVVYGMGPRFSFGFEMNGVVRLRRQAEELLTKSAAQASRRPAPTNARLSAWQVGVVIFLVGAATGAATGWVRRKP